MTSMRVRTSEFEITEAMIQHGGGFVSLLGRLLRAADAETKRRLIETFPEYIEQYDDLAVLMTQREAAQAHEQPAPVAAKADATKVGA